MRYTSLVYNPLSPLLISQIRHHFLYGEEKRYFWTYILYAYLLTTLEKKMRVVTWNVNGIRATSTTSAKTSNSPCTTTTTTTSTKSLQNLLDSLDADIICLQETKITRSLIQDDIAHVPGYLAFFSCSRRKEGYSGVVTYCRKSVCPVAAQEGLTQLWSKSSGDTCIKGGDDCVLYFNDFVMFNYQLRFKLFLRKLVLKLT